MDLYRNGFLIGPPNSKIINDIELGSDWNKEVIGNLALQYHRDLNVFHISNGDDTLIFMGTVMDVFHNYYNDKVIGDELLALWTNNELDAFYDRMDCLSGSFIVLISSNTNLFVWPDTLASKAVFYDTVTEVIVSHPQILAEYYNYSVSDEYADISNQENYQNDKDRFLPGLITPFENILQLTPNTMCTMPGSVIERFFPRKNNAYENKEVAGDILGFFEKQMDLLCKKNKIAISATAGMDSRLTIASSKAFHENIYYYTAIYNPIAESDAKFAHEMLQQLGCEHHMLEQIENVPQAFLDVYHRNTSDMSTNFRGEIAYLLECHYPSNRVHIKSNGSEICRAYHRAHSDQLPDNPTGETISRLYNQIGEYYTRHYQDMIERTGLTTDRLYNYDIYDLIYWEVRIGKWQSLCILEWSGVQDTIMPYNCRKLIEMMLSTSLKSRMNDTFYKSLIDKMWKETNSFKYNPHIKKNKNFLRRIKRGVKRLLLKR